ncbi:MAG: elongation factor 4, partial [bacterium]|nr:elongation factor 4 [bacterium]
IQERIEREYGLALVATAPSVVYRVTRTNGRMEEIDNPSKMPAPQEIELLEEPYIEATVMIPTEYVGAVMELCQERRGNMVKMDYPTPQRVVLTYELPLSEILMDFFDALKSGTRGYASLDYDMKGYREADLVKLDMLINSEPVDALSSIVHQDKSLKYGRMLAERLRKILPRQLFDVRIQAAIGNKIIASETVKALRKDVLAKCYGGDISRKRKLLEKQKEGKKRMKQVGNVEIPQEAFLAVLEIGD